jgi:hypothetical protein
MSDHSSIAITRADKQSLLPARALAPCYAGSGFAVQTGRTVKRNVPAGTPCSTSPLPFSRLGFCAVAPASQIGKSNDSSKPPW